MKLQLYELRETHHTIKHIAQLNYFKRYKQTLKKKILTNHSASTAINRIQRLLFSLFILLSLLFVNANFSIRCHRYSSKKHSDQRPNIPFEKKDECENAKRKKERKMRALGKGAASTHARYR